MNTLIQISDGDKLIIKFPEEMLINSKCKLFSLYAYDNKIIMQVSFIDRLCVIDLCKLWREDNKIDCTFDKIPFMRAFDLTSFNYLMTNNKPDTYLFEKRQNINIEFWREKIELPSPVLRIILDYLLLYY